MTIIFLDVHLLGELTMTKMQTLIEFIKHNRKQLGLTQQGLANKTGINIRFIRNLEQGKETVRVDKVNKLLSEFGYELGPIKSKLIHKKEE